MSINCPSDDESHLFSYRKGVIVIEKSFDFQKMVSKDIRDEIERELNRTMEDVQRINVSSTFEFLFESEGGQVQGGGKVWLSAPARDGLIAVAVLVFITAAGICLYVWVRRSKFSYIFLKTFFVPMRKLLNRKYVDIQNIIRF